MGTSDLRNACSLEDSDLALRLEMIRTEIAPHVLRGQALPGGEGAAFELPLDLRAKLESLVALERECCGGLEFTLRPTAEGARLRLEISGADPGQLLATFGRPAPPGRGDARPLFQLFQSLGLGVGGALFVCCLLPLALAGVAGVAIAGPLLALDQAAVLVPASLAGAGGAWLWLRHRGRRDDCGDGC